MLELQITQSRHLKSVADRQTKALTFGFLLRTYNVRKSSQESVSTQQIQEKRYSINLILSLLAPFYANEFYS